MLEGKDWVTKRANDAHKAYPSVTDSAVTRIVDVLRGEAMQRLLSTAELHHVAKALLGDLELPALAKTGITDAD